MRTASIPEESWDAVPLFVVPGTHPASLDTTRVFTGSQLLPMVRREAIVAGLPPDGYSEAHAALMGPRTSEMPRAARPRALGAR